MIKSLSKSQPFTVQCPAWGITGCPGITFFSVQFCVFSFPQAPHSLHSQVLRHLPWDYKSNCMMYQTSSTQMKCKPLVVVGAAEDTQIRPGGDRREGLAAAHSALSHFPVLLSLCISTEAREAHRAVNYC